MTGPTSGHDEPEVAQAVLRGSRCRCPACGSGRLFGRFLKVEPACTRCGQVFSHHRADDFPPYLVMFAVGHVCGYGIYLSETRFEGLPLWLHAVLWPTLAIGLSLGLLQPVKGAVIGLQYGLRMHGFGALREHRREARPEGRSALMREGGPETGERPAPPRVAAG